MIALAVTGGTYPLWGARIFGAEGNVGTEFLSESSSPSLSSSSLPTSNPPSSEPSSGNAVTSSDASSSGTSSSDETSSSSSSNGEDLSPYIPGLKQLVLEDSSGRSTMRTLYKTNTVFYVDSGSFNFTTSNASQYALKFVLKNAPAGITLKEHTGETLYYAYRYLLMDSTTADQATFSLQAKVYATAHPESVLYSNAMTLTVSNPPQADYNSTEFQGLKNVDILIDGVSSKIPASLGTHKLTVATNPANYLADHPNISVSFGCGFGARGFAQNGDTITFTDDGDGIGLGTAPNYLYTTLKYTDATLHNHFCSVDRPITFACDEEEHYGDPGFYILDGSATGGDYGLGTYKLNTHFESWVKTAYNDSDYTFKCLFNDTTIPDGLSLSYGGLNEDIVLTVPSSLKKQVAYSFSAYLISKADSTQVKKASPFYVYGL